MEYISYHLRNFLALVGKFFNFFFDNYSKNGGSEEVSLLYSFAVILVALTLMLSKLLRYFS